MVRGLTRYKFKAREKREKRARWEAVDPCGLSIRRVISLCGKGHRILTGTCRVPVNELWRYREFTWNPRKSFDPHHPNFGTWKGLYEWMKRTQWADSNPLDFTINPQAGVNKVANGNHRLVLAKKLRLKTAPVSYSCKSGLGLDRMLRPDYGKTITRPGITGDEEEVVESISRQKRRNWKMIARAHAKFFHKRLRRARKEINKALHGRAYLHYVRRTGRNPCKAAFDRAILTAAVVAKRVPRAEEGARSMWEERVWEPLKEVMLCINRNSDLEREYVRKHPSIRWEHPEKRKRLST
jgi:hypothetical protein